MNTTPSYHLHDIMQMMATTGQTYTHESLRAAIIKEFGAEARFASCSARGMDALQAVGFLEERGKFAPVEGGFTLGSHDGGCNH